VGAVISSTTSLLVAGGWSGGFSGIQVRRSNARCGPVPAGEGPDTGVAPADQEPQVLWSLLAMVLERNVSGESVLAYKIDDLAHRTRLARLLGERLDALDEPAALHLTRVGVVFLTADPRLADARVDFPAEYADMLGLAARGLLSCP
jgi:hypothetical protein